MCGNTLEPDPRYDSCCSNIFRPGKVLRDIIKGLLVVLGIAVVIAVVFVIIFYVVPGKECVSEDLHCSVDATCQIFIAAFVLLGEIIRTFVCLSVVKARDLFVLKRIKTFFFFLWILHKH